jgi:hypothetical protein
MRLLAVIVVLAVPSSASIGITAISPSGHIAARCLALPRDPVTPNGRPLPSSRTAALITEPPACLLITKRSI